MSATLPSTSTFNISQGRRHT